MDRTSRPTTEDHPPHDEVFEAVPWDALVRPASPLSGRWPMVAALAVGVLAVTVAVVRAYWPVSSSPPVPSTVSAVVAQAPTPPVSVVPPPSSTPASEADLMAIDPAALDRAVGAYAEWYSSRYFTRSGSASTLDPHLELELAANGRFESYVESTHAVDIQVLSADRRRVTVVVRLLVSTDAEMGYVRQPDRAVEVVVHVDDDGLAVEDLPLPVALPSPVIPLPALVEVDRPDLVALARGRLALFGTPAESPYHVGATADGRTRVGLLVTDESGASWPHAVWFAADGSLLP